MNCFSFTHDLNLINEYNTYDNYYAIVDGLNYEYTVLTNYDTTLTPLR